MSSLYKSNLNKTQCTCTPLSQLSKLYYFLSYYSSFKLKMVTKSPLSLHLFSNKTSTPSSSSSTSTSSSSSLSTMKLKTLTHNLIFSHICRVVRAISKAKSIFLELIKENQLIMCMKQQQPQRKDHNKYMKKILFGSFRLHYNWCSHQSSHVMPLNSSTIFPTSKNTTTHNNHIYYDSTWNSAFATDDDEHVHEDDDQAQFCNSGCYGKEEEGQLSSYLQWLEEKGGGKVENLNRENGDKNEIDKLADMFIANCHEKFRLEKIESYRRYQEMLARSM